MSANPPTLEGTKLTHLVVPQKIAAKDVKGCVEIYVDANNVRNPLHKAEGEPEFIGPQELVKKLLENGWKVITVAYKRDDTGNLGHDPTVTHNLVMVMVKV